MEDRKQDVRDNEWLTAAKVVGLILVVLVVFGALLSLAFPYLGRIPGSYYAVCIGGVIGWSLRGSITTKHDLLLDAEVEMGARIEEHEFACPRCIEEKRCKRLAELQESHGELRKKLGFASF